MNRPTVISAVWTAVAGTAILLGTADGFAQEIVRPITSFESKTYVFEPTGCKPTRVKEHVTDGAFALRVDVQGSGRDSWPGLYLDAGTDGDWTGRKLLFDAFVAGDKACSLSIRLDDLTGKKIFSGLLLQPGQNRDVVISIEKAAAGKASVKHIQGILIYESVPREDWTLFFDHMRFLAPDTQSADRIASFESDRDTPFSSSSCKISRVKALTTHGVYSLKVEIPGSEHDTWPGIAWLPPDTDWSSRDALVMDIFVPGAEHCPLAFRIDSDGKPSVFHGLSLTPGWNTDVILDLKALANTVNRKSITKILFYISRPRKPATFYLDNLRFGAPPEPRAQFRRQAYVEPGRGVVPTATDKERGFQLFSRSYLQHVFPNSLPDNHLNRLSLFTTRGEKEPLTFSLHALRECNRVMLHVSDASGPARLRLPASAWHAGFVVHRDQRTVYSAKTYVADMPSFIEPLTAPVDVPAGTTQRFWLTLNTPPEAPAGIYTGQVSLVADGQTLRIPFSVRVLPFALPEAKGFFFGPYYRMWQGEGAQMDARAALHKDLTEMRRQGMTSVGLCFGVDPASYRVAGDQVEFAFNGKTPFEWFMDTYRDLGFPSDLVLLSDSGRTAAHQAGAINTKSYARTYISFHKSLAAEATRHHWPRIYVQPYDEPGYHDEQERKNNEYHLKLLREAGIRSEQDGPPDSYFVNRGGPLADMWTCNGRIVDSQVLQKAIQAGKKVLIYNCDVEHYRPETDRWAYGLFNWRNALHGAFNWEYCGGSGSLYNTFDGRNGDWIAYYPAGHGWKGGPSTGWEGMREGVDDRRYLLLLEQLIARGKAKGGPSAKLAQEASIFLDDLRLNLDDAAGVRGRAVWSAALTREEATKHEAMFCDKEAQVFVVGPLKQPNGVTLAEYDAIRWTAAEHAVRLHDALAGQSAPVAAFHPQPVKQRFRVLTTKHKTDSPASGSRPVVTVAELTAAPKIDGVIDGDAAWKGASTVSMVLTDGTGNPEMPTLVHLGRWKDTLCFGFVCHENRTHYMTANAKTSDQKVWTDDCVEVFIDALNDQKGFHQLIVNSLGAVCGYTPTGASWKPGVQAAARVQHNQNRWFVEIAVPVRTLELGSQFGLNVCRERRPVEAYELSSWSVTGSSFAVPSRFGIATFDTTATQDHTAVRHVALRVSPTWSLTSQDELTATLHLTGLSGAEKVTLTLAGNDLKETTGLPRPHAEHFTLAVAVGDLPPGSYTLTATLTSPEEDPKTAAAFFSRCTGPFDATKRD